MLSEKEMALLKEHFLFAKTEKESLISFILSKAQIRYFLPGETVYDTKSFERAVGIVLSGKVSLQKKSEGKIVLLGQTEEGGLFGAAALFGAEETYVTYIRAVEKTTILFLQEKLLEELFLRYPEMAMSYIRFLSERIRLLNKKIDRYVLQSPEGKVAAYLLGQSGGKEEMKLSITISDLAKTLSISRAALYRTLETMEKEKLFLRSGKNITKMDRERLEALRS